MNQTDLDTWETIFHLARTQNLGSKVRFATAVAPHAALDVATRYEELFSEPDVADCFYLLDDFLSSGRISGKQRIPLAKLEAGQKFPVDGQRLEVNPSVDRYKRELKNLADAL